MEVDTPAAEQQVAEQEQTASLQLPLNILSIIKSAQLQNGLKHGDYGRYRQYCARRLRSLYKAVKFLHGKGRYQKKKLDVPQISDARHLHIVLVSAERCWAHAMQLKQEAEAAAGDGGAPDARKRHHALRRLRKAQGWAAELARLAAAVCDMRGALEADAYASWMSGNVLMERETDWHKALAAYTKATKLFSELAKVGDPESQALCGSMVEELGPALRYCNYQIQRAGGQAPDPAALLSLAEGGGEGGGLLQSKLASLAAEAQTAQASSTSSFEWRGIKAGVSQERIRLPLHSAAEMAAALEGAMDTDGSSADTLLPQHDRLINAYAEARAAARSALKAAQAGAGSSSAAAGMDAEMVDIGELTSLEQALSGRILEASLARGQVAVADAHARFTAGLARQAAGKGARAGKDRPAKPEDLVRLTTNLTQLATELEEHASHMGGKQGEALAAAAAGRGAGYAAWRVYYLGHLSLAAGGRWAEAAGLFRRAAERAAAAQEAIQELPKSEAAAWASLPGLTALAAAAQAYLLVAAAEAAAEGAAGAEGAAKGLEGLGLAAQQQQQQATQQYLADALDVWESFAGSSSGSGPSRGARIYQGPYALAPIAPRPIMLDSAAAEIDYPDVSHRLPKRRKTAAADKSTSTFARLFGGWGAAS